MKSGFPYLADLSITSFCPFGMNENASVICKNCYQSSTTTGKPATRNNIIHIAKVLESLNTLEIVLGGGEPTLWKDNYYKLSYVLGEISRMNFKVGLTTRNYAWYRSDDFNVDSLNTIAISANTLNDVVDSRNLVEAIKKTNSKVKIYLQTVLGAISWDDNLKFVDSVIANYKHEGLISGLTFLGYKDFGFGQKSKEQPFPENWVEIIKEKFKNTGISIGVDSIIVRKHQEQILKNGVKQHFLVGVEGKQTCYIDAVNMKIQPSSFTTESYNFPTFNRLLSNYSNESEVKSYKKEFLNIWNQF
jgi:MoaA/NifB/PqqE/SkfB family radical SAM enzyme